MNKKSFNGFSLSTIFFTCLSKDLRDNPYIRKRAKNMPTGIFFGFLFCAEEQLNYT
jgi:hypothetical protein